MNVKLALSHFIQIHFWADLVNFVQIKLLEHDWRLLDPVSYNGQILSVIKDFLAFKLICGK